VASLLRRSGNGGIRLRGTRSSGARSIGMAVGMKSSAAKLFTCWKEMPMSGTGDKIKGYANEAIGNVKQGIGKMTGSKRMQAEGVAQELKGEAQQTVGDVKNAASDAYDQVTSSSTADKVSGHYNDAAGNVKQKVGRAVGSPELEAEGIAQEVEGEAQKASGAIKKGLGR
jgi:uncharacterized protein YjbJ (UPF0337 family)